MQRETSTREFKRQLTDTFLKTVSAFANYGGGEILFGVEDDGTVVGIDDPSATMLAIENKINNLIDPRPEYKLSLDDDGTICLAVSDGQFKPYFYQNKAFKRHDTSTVSVGRLELTRLILEGSNQDFEELDSRRENLTFDVLEAELKDRISLSGLTEDTLRTLQLMTPAGRFNNAAELLSDQNSFPGIDIAVFGESINEIRFRREVRGSSLLALFHEATDVFRQYYVSEHIDGEQRSVVARIPENAFREALANALVHRTWDTPSPIKISIFEDRLEVTSPGALPPGLTFDDYLHGQLSLLRNPIIGTVFFRLGYIERFGTGIARINYEYADASTMPEFIDHGSSITVRLPILAAQHQLTDDERRAFDTFIPGELVSRAQVEERSGLSRDKAIRALNALTDKRAIRREGKARNTLYIREV